MAKLSKHPLYRATFLILPAIAVGVVITGGLFLGKRLLSHPDSTPVDSSQKSDSHPESTQTDSPQKSNPYLQLQSVSDRSIQSFKLGEHNLSFEVVNTSSSMRKGLSGRKEIGADGMLFVFSQADYHGIWMKEMEFDIDLIWLDGEKVTEITYGAKAPLPNQPLKDLPTYKPRQPVNMVLEARDGFVKEHEIEIGDWLELL